MGVVECEVGVPLHHARVGIVTEILQCRAYRRMRRLFYEQRDRRYVMRAARQDAIDAIGNERDGLRCDEFDYRAPSA